MHIFCILQPPITVHGIPGRYASALYTAAAKAGTLEAVQDDLIEVLILLPLSSKQQHSMSYAHFAEAYHRLSQVYNLTGESAEFEQFLYDPSVPKNKKVPALNAILDKMEVNEVTKHFFGENCRELLLLGSCCSNNLTGGHGTCRGPGNKQ